MVAQFPSGRNTFVPDHAAGGAMVVNYTRNPAKFALARYAQMVPVKKNVGLYLKMTVEEAGRIINTDLAEFAWPDGAPDSDGRDETESFEFLPFRTNRRRYKATIGQLAAEQAEWDIVQHHSGIKAQQAMTARTQLAITAATTSGNYDSSHVSAVASISGNTGNWAASTTARMDIKRSIEHACEKVLDDTLAVVDPEDLMLVISSGCAKQISLSQEIVDYVKGSPFALAQIRGEVPNRNMRYGLPEQLYGVNLVIEATRKVTSRKGASSVVKSPVLPDATPFLCARPGGIEGQYGAPSFSTITIFTKEDMTVETKTDTDNRLTWVRVVDDCGVVITAPATGFLFTSAV